jgi:hypothetical protein
MGDLWTDEGFGGDGFGGGGFEGADDWDEGEESLETGLEEGFDDPDAADEDASRAGEDDEL